MEFFKNAPRPDPNSVLRYISELSQFHRIQGSEELVRAAEFVAEEVSDFGVDVKILKDRYDGRRWHLTLKSPIAWNPIWGELVFDNRRLTTNESPLLVMAHSPGGEMKGKLLPVLRDDDWKRAEGKVVLVGEDWRNAYRRANLAGASGFIAYRKGTGEFYPYIGLFLTKDDLKWARIPAFTVPEAIAEELMRRAFSGGVAIRGTVQANVKGREVLPMVYAKTGEPPYLLFTAHICHPKPGANDNASGSALLMELARILEKAKKERFGYAFLWIPEYHGSQAFAERVQLEEYYAGVNLDMVGGSVDRSGSTLMLIRTPFSRFSLISGLLETAIEHINVRGESFSGSPLPLMPFKAYPYEMGSDHDVFNILGIPAAMPITWPDRYYHSSGDTLDRISGETLLLIGRAVLSLAVFLSEGNSSVIERMARGYMKRILGEVEIRNRLRESEGLLKRGLARDMTFLGISSEVDELSIEPWLEWKKRGVLSEGFIKARNRELAREFSRLTREKAVLTHLHELLMLGEILPEERAYAALREEYGKIEEEKLERLVGILEDANVVSAH